MEKIKIKTKKDKYKILLTLGIILFVIFMILNVILNTLNQQKAQEDIAYEDIATLQDVLSYYKCRLISEESSALGDFTKDIKLELRYDLYNGEKSNEEYYNNLIKDVAKVLNYINFRLIDDSKEIEIKVICKNKKIYSIIINDIEEYFVYMDSQIDLKKYKEIEKTNLQIDSQEIVNLINSNWNTTTFGTRDSIFDEYNIYFDEGIKARTINGKIYNIVFSKKYNGNVVNGMFPGIDFSTIKSKLGEPTFEDDELEVIGYKGQNIYVFFTKNEISVYRLTDVDTTDFFKLVDKLLEDELDLLDFMNELTYLWPDYSEYKYDSDYAFISYPLKGIDVKIGYENTNAIVLYNNVNAELTKIQRYLENVELVANLQVDNVFEAEKRRITEENSLLEKCKEYEENKTEDEQKNTGESLKFGILPELDGSNRIMKLSFISKNGEFSNRELNDNVYTYTWLNSDILIFSQQKNGIFYYNVITGERSTIIRNEEQDFKIKGIENGVLEYDDSELELIIQY